MWICARLVQKSRFLQNPQIRVAFAGRFSVGWFSVSCASRLVNPRPPLVFFPLLIYRVLCFKVHDVDHGGVEGPAVVRALGKALLGDALHVPVPQPKVGTTVVVAG